MKQPQIGDLVLCKKNNTQHIVESIEIIDEKIYVFTEDSKCFPLDRLSPSVISQQQEVFLKFSEGKKLNSKELEIFESKLKELNIVPFVWKGISPEEFLKSQGYI
jgi:hypothetical protein